MIRKKLRSVCIALVLCLLLLPAAALAADGTVYGTIEVGGIALTNSENAPTVYATTDDSGNVITEGADENNYNVMWDGSTLTLRNATIQQAEEYGNSRESMAIYRQSGDLAIALVGENTVDAPGNGSASSCGINLGGGSLTINGEENASLLVFGGPTTNGNSCGIYARGTITIDSGTVTVTGESASAASYGICAGGAVTINDGSVTATSGEAGGVSYGICASGAVTINGGTVTATGGSTAEGISYGIYGNTAVTINGGTVNATGGSTTGGSANGTSYGIYTHGSVTIEDGTVNVTGGEADEDSYGIYASSFTINGGTVVATGGEAANRYSMGVRADGGITINDGVVTATGDTAPDFSYGMYTSGNFTMNGGIVTATSGEAQLTYGIRGGTLTIKSGTLDATSGKTVQDSVGIFAAYDIKIDGGTVTAKGGETIGDGWYNFGIRSHSGSVIITDGTVTATGGKANGTGEENHSAGIFVRTGSITVSGGTVTATGGESTGSGINYSAGLYAGVSVTVSGGTATATGGLASTGSTADAGGSYGIIVESTGTTADVTINGNSVVRANMTGEEGVDGEPISGGSIDKQNGIIFENGEGTMYGDVTLQEDLTVGADESLTIPQGAMLNIPEGTTLTNYGTMTNNGTINNQGTLTIEPGGNLAGDVTGNQAIYKVTNVTLNRSNLSLTAGGTAWLRAAVQPDNAANKMVTWSTSDASIATVTDGVVTAVAPGTATITATTVDGGFTAICTVTVRPDIPPANPNYRITVEATQGGAVTADPTAAKAGTTVTLTPVPDRGYQVGAVAVTDRFGDAVAVTEQADGTYTFTMPNGQVTVTVTFAEAPLPFHDVTEGDWFYEAVRCAYETGLMDGVGDNLFAPNSQTTRAQLVTILYRLEGEPEVSGTSGFTDVEAGTWYTDAVAWAAANGIVNGVSETEFAPGKDITREQLATILFRYAEAKGYDVSARADLSAYTDADQIQSYAAESVAWAVAEGLIQGFEDNTLRPAGNATRAQIATILMRFCEGVAK